MRVMTFNIQHALGWQEQRIDFDLFADFIKEQDPDICGLNEVRGKGTTDPEYTNQLPVLSAKTDLNGYFGQSALIFGTDPYGNAILSRTPFVSCETVPIPDPEDGSCKEGRSVIKVVTVIEGHKVCFLVTHFGLNDNEKKNAVDTVCGLIDSADMPLVLMGDFNVTPDDPVLEPIRQRLYDADRASDIPAAFTWPSYGPESKIDYIFYKGLVCKTCKTVCQVVSDHFPLIAEFDFEEEA